MALKTTVLILGTVWPEPKASAAGVRMVQWIDEAKRQSLNLIYASVSEFEASKHGWIHDFGGVVPLQLNRENEAKEKLKTILKTQRDDLGASLIVVYDRFIAEEHWGHVIQDLFPKAETWIEAQDLHFLRRERERSWYQRDSACDRSDRYRELLSFLRVDRVVVISKVEREILCENFGLSPSQVLWWPLRFNPCPPDSRPWSKRKSYVFIGNHRHSPNAEAIRWLAKEGIQHLRSFHRDAEIKVYGSYPQKSLMELHRPEMGFYMMGFAPTLQDVFGDARVNLAPLAYGAGVKGKILDAASYGVPTVSTSLGIEGLSDKSEAHFPGLVGEREHFMALADRLYHDEVLWTTCAERAGSFFPAPFSLPFQEKQETDPGQVLLSASGWLRDALRFEAHFGRRYFSRWIELKERSGQ